MCSKVRASALGLIRFQVLAREDVLFDVCVCVCVCVCVMRLSSSTLDQR